MRNLVNGVYRGKAIAPVDAPADTNGMAADDDAPPVRRQSLSEREFEELCIAIAQLPERLRHVFVLRKVYGYSCREIAEHLGSSTNAVREQLAQGFKKLQTLRNGQGELQRKRRRTNRQKNDKMRPFSVTPLRNRE